MEQRRSSDGSHGWIPATDLEKSGLNSCILTLTEPSPSHGGQLVNEPADASKMLRKGINIARIILFFVY